MIYKGRKEKERQASLESEKLVLRVLLIKRVIGPNESSVPAVKYTKVRKTIRKSKVSPRRYTVASASISGNPCTEALQRYLPDVDESTVSVRFGVLPTTWKRTYVD